MKYRQCKLVLHWQCIELQGAKNISYLRLFLSLYTKMFSVRSKANRIKDTFIFNEMYSDTYLIIQNDEVKHQEEDEQQLMTPTGNFFNHFFKIIFIFRRLTFAKIRFCDFVSSDISLKVCLVKYGNL